MKQPHLSCSHQANVVDTSCSEIKANRVPARRHTTLFRQENRYANLRANPSNLARPSCSPCNDGSTGVCHLLSTTTTTTPSLFRSFPFLLSPPSQLRPIVLDFFLFASLSLSLPSHPLVSLYHPVCDARFSSKYAFFSFRRAPVLRAGSRACDDGRARGRSDAERWVRGYKTGLARV